ncbi:MULTISPECIES: hypothetical protein [unclassified Pseudoalteromonas]|uniref:hypothetical protein n=1 Tax=unclassified Pseudoalteromonas TaxID=194690 RepID=UPI001600A2F0|nr:MULTISPECIES: hypothetical protein [unclassified Pseudoalteromonas]MBB1334525.1 hypothetical protein [Pseudoalteromonas sp. SR41-6]MBB1458537.1 hypothetical protein [Pseudoalteromonas sp. SG41-8]MBB1469990.1 hypothetical protein [Pseudoalteromonas sp. SG41-5]
MFYVALMIMLVVLAGVSYKQREANFLKFNIIIILISFSIFYLFDLIYNNVFYQPKYGEGAPMSIVAVIILTLIAWLWSALIKLFSSKLCHK